MNSESRSSLPVAVEENDENKNSVDFGESGETTAHDNGSCEAQNTGFNEGLKERGTHSLDSVSSFSSEKKSEASSSPSPSKGHGLKKWKRIKRDARKVGESSVDTGKMVMPEELPNSVVHPSKRAQVFAERDRKSEGFVSSRNQVIGNLDGFTLLADPNLVMGPLMDGGTDSENSSSKSSTAASVPKVKYDMPVAVGFPHDKSKMWNLSGTSSPQKGRIDAVKKARGERVKTDKENSRSSMESDSRSSNYVFRQGTYATSNGIRSERHEGENGDVNVDQSREDEKEKGENHGSSSDQDPLVESMLALQTAQEALQKELLKIKEISKDISIDDSESDILPEMTDVGKNFQQQSSEQYSSGDSGKQDAERELEDLFRQRIEAEIEYLTISRTVHKLRVDAKDQITRSPADKTPVTEQKTKEAVQLEHRCEGSASSDETLKLQKKVCKYTSYFLVQLLSLLVIFEVCLFQLSPNYVEVVPT